GRLRREGQDRDVLRDAEFCRRVPPGLIEDEDGVRARIDGGADGCQMGVHRLGIAPWQDQADAFAFLRTDGPEDIGRLSSVITRRTGACSAPGPAPRQLVLLADAGFVLEPDFDRYARNEARADRRQLGVEVFLKSSTANSFCA